ncbi:response regulator [Planococcus salinus]|uniref:Transcriptional regulatory protein n=1 Tax=Planococcus salinus TaxID=1848460 RepID=A0A3M8P5N2_9BACL|nr:response regulator [Planococcus salinus]RNF38912.1 response regulator [Planococcus salinus]
MKSSIDVLIVEDDFRVADINRQLVEKVKGFRVIGIAKTGEEAIQFLQSQPSLPHLILLDVYIPDRTGLSLFWEIRRNYHQIDIIMLSAAKETATVEEALRGGIFDYIIKPVDFSRFEKTLMHYAEQQSILSSRQELEQEDIDRLIGLQKSPASENPSAAASPKGIDQITLQKVREILTEVAGAGINALETGKAVGVSRSTARRYLEYLVSLGEAKAQLVYGEIGRPERRYRHEQNDQNSQNDQ